MNRQVLLVQLAGQRVAFPAIDVDSVVDLETIMPVPGVPPHILGLSTLRSRAVTVIDCAQLLGRERGRLHESRRAAVCAVGGHDYALLVDAVEDVCVTVTQPSPIPGGAGAHWSEISAGLVETKAGSAMLVDPKAFVSVPGEDPAGEFH
ncbi:chemotaxis protein CheW [Altererythrobacter aquiaggeris]|uniref:chemotaxis protein CheW n=1 Tax=Aestuarierythrobacter aquiaggeris TaxID=1898396 RepID=UPI00301668BF